MRAQWKRFSSRRTVVTVARSATQTQTFIALIAGGDAIASPSRSSWEYSCLATLQTMRCRLAAAAGRGLGRSRYDALDPGAAFNRDGRLVLVPDKADDGPQGGRVRPARSSPPDRLFYRRDRRQKRADRTVALAARFNSLVLVTAGTTNRMLLANAPVVLSRRRQSPSAFAAARSRARWRHSCLLALGSPRSSAVCPLRRRAQAFAGAGQSAAGVSPSPGRSLVPSVPAARMEQPAAFALGCRRHQPRPSSRWRSAHGSAGIRCSLLEEGGSSEHGNERALTMSAGPASPAS